MLKSFVFIVTVILATTLLLSPTIHAEESYYQWVNVTNSAAWNPRDGAGGLVYDGKMWLIGGWNPSILTKKCSNDVWSSTDGANWTQVKANTFTDSYDPATDWEGRHTAGYVVYQDKMWIVGGDPLQGHYQYDVWNSTDGANWTHVNENNPVPWGPRALHHTLVFDGKIWVMGGQTTPQFAPADEHFYNDIWNSTDGVNWTQVQTEGEMWCPRGQIGNSVVFNGRMWILGGGTYDTPEQTYRNFYNDVWSSADGIHWEKHLDNAPWYPRQYHEVAVWDNKMWVMEGWNGGNRNDVWYSDDGVNWTEVPNTPWNPRHAATVYTYDDALWMVAGNNMERDVWKLVRTAAPPEPTSEDVDFENPVYVSGNSFLGIDGWSTYLGATNVVTPDAGGSGDTRVIDGTRSARLGGDSRSIMYRNFAEGAAYADGSTISIRMIADGPAGGQAEFHFSNSISTLATPAGIIGVAGENFHLYGLGGDPTVGIDTGVPFLTGIDYLMEIVLNLTDQSFTCFATNMTDGGERVSLGTASFNQASGAFVGPEDFADSAYVVITRNNLVAIIDNLSLAAATYIPGDANRDGKVDASDAEILASNWQTATGATWADGDFNGDGAVDDVDATILATNWQTGANSNSVPEPSMSAPLFALVFGALFTIVHNNRTRQNVN